MAQAALPLPLVLLACGALLVAGGALVWWGWRFDIAKGRRRCPACWYDMSAAPGMTCPECGARAAAPAALLKTRRSRARLALGAMLILSSAIPVHYLKRDRLWGWVPSPVLVRFIDPVKGSSQLREELYLRMTAGELSDEDWTTLALRHLAGGCSDLGARVSTRSTWATGAPVMLTFSDDAPFRGHFIGRRLRIDTGRNRTVTFGIAPRGAPAVASWAPIAAPDRSLSIGTFRPGRHRLTCECAIEEAVVEDLSGQSLGWRTLVRCPITIEFEVVTAAESASRTKGDEGDE